MHGLLLAGLLLAAGGTMALAQQRIETQQGAVEIETLSRELIHPWGMTFLPDGRLLVTERPGRLRIASAEGELSQPLKGVPQVFARGQGGLLDVALDPDFAENRFVYLTYSEPGAEGASTAVARGRLEGEELSGTEVIFRQEPKVSGDKHFGSRLAFTSDRLLFVTTGERFRFDPAQDLSNHLGKVLRIARDGSVPQDNPFVGRRGAEPEIWSYGHRNVEAAAVHPETGQLFIGEMGPQGGDELNLPQAGRNYGWPLVSWGEHYGGRDIPDPPSRPELADSIYRWTPVISPSGMLFYEGDLFDWRGDLLIGSLSQRALVRLEIEEGQVVAEERLPLGARIRDVAEGPDGAIYLLTDHDPGALLRLTPLD